MLGMSRACPCCGYLTLDDPQPGSFELCPICFWEDDSAQSANPDDEGGANRQSLRQSERNFADFGAYDSSMCRNVRPVSEADRRDPNWAPLSQPDLDRESEANS